MHCILYTFCLWLRLRLLFLSQSTDSSLLIHHGHFGGWLLGTHWHLFNSPHRPIGNYSFSLYSALWTANCVRSPDRVISYASYFSISTFSFSCFCRVGARIMQLIVRHVNYLAPETRSRSLPPLFLLPFPFASAVKWVIKPTFERAIKSRFQKGGNSSNAVIHIADCVLRNTLCLCAEYPVIIFLLFFWFLNHFIANAIKRIPLKYFLRAHKPLPDQQPWSPRNVVGFGFFFFVFVHSFSRVLFGMTLTWNYSYSFRYLKNSFHNKLKWIFRFERRTEERK